MSKYALVQIDILNNQGQLATDISLKNINWKLNSGNKAAKDNKLNVKVFINNK